MRDVKLPDMQVPADMQPEEMPDLLRYWYLGTKARRHMVLRRFHEVDSELTDGIDGTVLDIGSAWGYNVMALSALGIPVVGMDLIVDQFAAGARIARANGLQFRVLGGDAACLPFPSDTFRSITMVETFEHVFEADRIKTLQECYRVLTPGGRLVLSTPNYQSVVERFKRLAVRLPWLQRRLPVMCYPASSTDRSSYHPYHYHSPSSVAAISSMLEQTGFSVTKVKFFLFVLKNTPNGLFPMFRWVETVFENTPSINRLAATACFTADKSG